MTTLEERLDDLDRAVELYLGAETDMDLRRRSAAVLAAAAAVHGARCATAVSGA